jgi:hypothetical protein
MTNVDSLILDGGTFSAEYGWQRSAANGDTR